MKKTDALRAVEIYNGYELVGPDGVFISQRTSPGRSVTPTAWAVCVRGRKFPGAWFEDGDKWFSYFGKAEKAKALEDAKAFATNETGVKDWTRDPFGNWVSQKVLDRALACAGFGPLGEVLAWLKQNPGGKSSWAAEALGKRESKVSEIMNRLEEIGLITGEHKPI